MESTNYTEEDYQSLISQLDNIIYAILQIDSINKQINIFVSPVFYTWMEHKAFIITIPDIYRALIKVKRKQKTLMNDGVYLGNSYPQLFKDNKIIVSIEEDLIEPIIQFGIAKGIKPITIEQKINTAITLHNLENPNG